MTYLNIDQIPIRWVEYCPLIIQTTWNLWKRKKDSVKSCPPLAIPWTVFHQAPLSMGFSRQEYWSGLPFPSPGDVPDQGIKPRSPTLQADALPFDLPGKPQKSSKGYSYKEREIWRDRHTEENAMWRRRQRLEQTSVNQGTPRIAGNPEAERKAWIRLSLSVSRRNQICWHLDFKALESRTVWE